MCLLVIGTPGPNRETEMATEEFDLGVFAHGLVWRRERQQQVVGIGKAKYDGGHPHILPCGLDIYIYWYRMTKTN